MYWLLELASLEDARPGNQGRIDWFHAMRSGAPLGNKRWKMRAIIEISQDICEDYPSKGRIWPILTGKVLIPKRLRHARMPITFKERYRTHYSPNISPGIRILLLNSYFEHCKTPAMSSNEISMKTQINSHGYSMNYFKSYYKDWFNAMRLMKLSEPAFGRHYCRNCFPISGAKKNGFSVIGGVVAGWHLYNFPSRNTSPIIWNTKNIEGLPIYTESCLMLIGFIGQGKRMKTFSVSHHNTH